jgi:hypothetical protein
MAKVIEFYIPCTFRKRWEVGTAGEYEGDSFSLPQMIRLRHSAWKCSPKAEKVLVPTGKDNRRN